MRLPKELTTVTTLSKILAGILFIALPFIGFFIGLRYQEMLNLAKSQKEENNIPIARIPTPTPIAIPTIDPSITANWKTYQSQKSSFLIKIPINFDAYLDQTDPQITTEFGLLKSYFSLRKTPDEIKSQAKSVSLDKYSGNHQNWLTVEIDQLTGAMDYDTYEKATFEKWRTQYINAYTASDYQTIGPEDIRLDGQPALRIYLKHQNFYQKEIIVFVENNLKWYRITARLDLDGVDKYEPLLDQILSTFKFTSTSTSVEEQQACPTPPTCSVGKNLIYGDPGPTAKSQCARYQCL